MKNIHVEKALSHLSQPSVSTASLPLLLFCPHANSSPLRSGNWERRFGSIWSEGGGGFFTEESMATTTRKKSTQEEEHFSLHIQQGFASMFAFRIVESWVTAFCSLPSLPVPSCCPSQPHIDMRKPILLLCYRPTTFVTSHQQRTLRRCPPLSAGTGARQWAQGAQRRALCLVGRQVQL